MAYSVPSSRIYDYFFQALPSRKGILQTSSLDRFIVSDVCLSLRSAGDRGFSTISVPFMLDYTRRFGHFSRAFLAEQVEKSLRPGFFDFLRYEGQGGVRPLPLLVAKPWILGRRFWLRRAWLVLEGAQRVEVSGFFWLFQEPRLLYAAYDQELPEEPDARAAETPWPCSKR